MKSSGDEVKAFLTETEKKILIITKTGIAHPNVLSRRARPFSPLEKPPSMVATIFIRRLNAALNDQ
jgi:hypothetical protein